MRSRSNAKTLQGTILEVQEPAAGSVTSFPPLAFPASALLTSLVLLEGCTIDGEDAEDCTEAIHDGEHECPTE